MILAILVISITFGTETEFQIGIVLFCLSAYCTFVFCHYSAARLLSSARWLHSLPKIVSSFDFFRIVSAQVSGAEEINNKIEQGCKNRHCHVPCPITHIIYNWIKQHDSIQNSKPFDFNWKNTIQKYSHIRKCRCV